MHATTRQALAALGAAALLAGSPSHAGQLIYLDFDTGSSPATPDHAYTAAERDAIEAALSSIFAPFGHSFTQLDPAPLSTTKVLFNDGGVGTSTAVDFRNLITTVDVAATDAGFALDLFGKPRSSAFIVQASVNLAAHELLHVLGARHHDGYHPVGAGSGGAGTASTFMSLTTLLGIDGDRIVDPALHISLRSALKLALADAGLPVPEGSAPNETLFEAEALSFTTLAVPNTLPPGDPLAGLPLRAASAIVLGALDGASGDLKDYFVFDGAAGQVVSLEVMSDVLGHRLDSFDAYFEVLDFTGTPLAPFATGSLDGSDPTLLDFLLPFDGPYFIEVGAEVPLAGLGEYELLVYQVGAVPEPAPALLLALGLAGLGLRRLAGPGKAAAAV